MLIVSLAHMASSFFSTQSAVQESDDLKARMAQVEAGADQATILTEENSSLRSQLTEANLQKAQSTTQLASLQSQLSEVQGRENDALATCDELEVEQERMLAENESLRAANAKLVAAKTELQNSYNVLQAEHEEQVAALSENTAAASDELAGLRGTNKVALREWRGCLVFTQLFSFFSYTGSAGAEAGPRAQAARGERAFFGTGCGACPAGGRQLGA